MKHKILMTLVLLMTVASGAWAEEVTIGDPTSTSTNSYLPSYSLYDYSFTQQIYTADEIGMSGTITTLTMWLKNTSSYARNINVYMKEVSGSIFEANNSWVSLSAEDLVGTATINNGVSNPTETTITLETPFEYLGTGNLLICIHDITGSWSSGLGGLVFETESNQSLEAHRDGTAYNISNPGVSGNLRNIKNVVRLGIVKLFQGYEIDVPAGEYVTYYKDEALKVEDENAKLYTITAVSGTTATATELTVAPANTPLLVKNNAAEKKTILLIPTTTDTPDNVVVYSGFNGTLEATELAGSTDTQANYVCTGKQFTWVKDAGTIAANRCWLELVSSTGAPVLDIVFGGNATGIDATKFTDDANDAWYDLNGRRLQAKPTTKGVYILNGRKVVVK